MENKKSNWKHLHFLEKQDINSIKLAKYSSSKVHVFYFEKSKK